MQGELGLRVLIATLSLVQVFRLTFHRLEIPPNAFDTHAKRVHQVGALRLLWPEQE